MVNDDIIARNVDLTSCFVIVVTIVDEYRQGLIFI